MEVQKRKLQEIAGSLLITIPKSWTRQYNLEKGNSVDVLLLDDGTLKIMPSFKEEHKEIKRAVIRHDRYVLRKFFREYLLGTHVIEIILTKPLSKAEREKITKFLKRLINVEIIEEGSKRIVIENLGTQKMPIRQAFSRMVFLTSSMFEDILNYMDEPDVLKTMNERDEVVDKFYFMVVANTRTFISKGYFILPERELTLLECLDYRLASEKVERVGDILKKMVPLLKKVKNKEVMKFGELVFEKYKKAVKSFLKKDLDTAVSLIDDAKEINAKAKRLKKKFERKKDVGAIEIVDYFLQIFEHGKDVGDLVR
ncbi:MAG: AbrB/MazE/SpoVT family DNA-binding domain-containing protein [Candidatus Aenigmatarchaeota archaeon]